MGLYVWHKEVHFLLFHIFLYCLTIWLCLIFVDLIFMSQIVLYFLHNISVLSFYIDAIFTLSILIEIDRHSVSGTCLLTDSTKAFAETVLIYDHCVSWEHISMREIIRQGCLTLSYVLSDFINFYSHLNEQPCATLAMELVRDHIANIVNQLMLPVYCQHCQLQSTISLTFPYCCKSLSSTFSITFERRFKTDGRWYYKLWLVRFTF